jgi:hypothetical protein
LGEVLKKGGSGMPLETTPIFPSQENPLDLVLKL